MKGKEEREIQRERDKDRKRKVEEMRKVDLLLMINSQHFKFAFNGKVLDLSRGKWKRKGEWGGGGYHSNLNS